MTNKTKRVPAIFKEDLIQFLQEAGEYDAVIAGERYCLVCGKIVTLETIQLLIPKNGHIQCYICEDPLCVERFNIERN